MRIDWNHERYRTRDRLLRNLDFFPDNPVTNRMPMVYPWENIALSVFERQLLDLAHKYGFTGDANDFFNRFSSGAIHYGTLNTFPIDGIENDLYLDTETDILYYFKATTETIDTTMAAKIGVAIVGQSSVINQQETITYLYIPIRALPIENLIYDCGDAAEFID